MGFYPVFIVQTAESTIDGDLRVILVDLLNPNAQRMVLRVPADEAANWTVGKRFQVELTPRDE